MMCNQILTQEKLEAVVNYHKKRSRIESFFIGLPDGSSSLIKSLITMSNPVTGIVSDIPYHDLANLLTIHPAPGRKNSGTPSKQTIHNHIKSIENECGQYFKVISAGQKLQFLFPELPKIFNEIFENREVNTPINAIENIILNNINNNNNILDKQLEKQNTPKTISQNFYPSHEIIARAIAAGHHNAMDADIIQEFIDKNTALGSTLADFNPIYLSFLAKHAERKQQESVTQALRQGVTMNELSIILIGNRHTEFANNKNILTYEQFNYLLQIESRLASSQNTYKVSIGQGLSDFQISAIRTKVEKDVFKGRFQLFGHLHNVVRAGNELTHKRYTCNSMISEPQKLYENKFLSFLMIDESCAEMSDHLTGQHIQGMVLIEASRQFVNCVAEKYLISKKNKKPKGFVLNSISSSFFDYIFPLEVEMYMEIKKMRLGLDDNFNASAAIQLYQNNHMAFSIDIDFSVMEKSSLLSIESRNAENLILNNLRSSERLLLDNSQGV